jgi:hypothetical protein
MLVVLLLGISLVTFKVYKGNYHLWLSDYLFHSPARTEGEGVTDIIFIVVDHWEPGGSMELVNAWMTGYRELADKHVDSDGRKLQHTWYYPIEQFRGYEVDSLVQLCCEGYGDVEVHLHHQGDNSQSLRKIFSDGLDSLQAHGALISADGKDHWSFVHGNWALDNSRLESGIDYCGVNDEISILLELGCYSDCTFPSLGQTAQPSLVNKIYYCTDDPQRPKSYDTGVRSTVGLKTRTDQLMIMEGPLMIDWADWRFKTHPTIEDGNLYWEIPTSLHRFELWLKANVHVEGRPSWVFVRPFTHGASLSYEGAYDNVLGSNIDRMLTEVESQYNDGKKSRLHYMTAREAYNVVKAAEAGLDGNPDEYRNLVIKPYLYRRETQR